MWMLVASNNLLGCLNVSRVHTSVPSVPGTPSAYLIYLVDRCISNIFNNFVVFVEKILIKNDKIVQMVKLDLCGVCDGLFEAILLAAQLLFKNPTNDIYLESLNSEDS